MYNGDFCRGQVWVYDNPPYVTRMLPAENVYWYNFGNSIRGLRDNERVGFRTGPYNGDRCNDGHTVVRGPGGLGCQDVRASTCIQFYQE
ncbi:hypothetical protein QBC38DRAFT_457408 [Podospora fimiseda]|uniref:Uncharacterized protein n=1 Tax=Podospora fimiseda TaxID=252190 RepID=A0AAN7BKL4_9PEZI|nr:hypothetical protein QBC38DRAFT_457408 [Podospora fimiseda]